MLGRIFRLLVVGSIASMVGAAIAATSLKRRLTPTTDEGADEITAVAIFGPLAFHSTSKAFRGGELECWYGGGVLDLRDAELAPEGATLKVRAVFGGGQIIVPASWKVVTRVKGMGGVQDVRPAQGHSVIDPELVIEGTLIAGGFAVTSELAEGEDDWLKAMKDRQDATRSQDATPSIAAEAMTETASIAEAPAATTPTADTSVAKSSAPAAKAETKSEVKAAATPVAADATPVAADATPTEATSMDEDESSSSEPSEEFAPTT